MSATITTIDTRDTTGRTIRPADTVLLLPHCLRSSATCRATAGEDGIDCVECNPACQVNILRKAALESGFRGICIAPGGSLALKYVKKTRPRAIIAVACEKELNEGITNVKELFGKSAEAPAVTIIPLVKDGCIDTRVDIQKAVDEISGLEEGFGKPELKIGSAW